MTSNALDQDVPESTSISHQLLGKLAESVLSATGQMRESTPERTVVIQSQPSSLDAVKENQLMDGTQSIAQPVKSNMILTPRDVLPHQDVPESMISNFQLMKLTVDHANHATTHMNSQALIKEDALLELSQLAHAFRNTLLTVTHASHAHQAMSLMLIDMPAIQNQLVMDQDKSSAT